MSDTELLNWQDGLGAQVWRDHRTNKWTLFLRVEDKEPIQPTASTLRLVLHAGYYAWRDRNK